jgi:bifunctional non-homologous end joining protein LigD
MGSHLVLPFVTPMAPTLIAQPFHHAGWIYEKKYDGWRVLAYKDAAGVRLVSRQGRDLTSRFPELAAAMAALEVPTLLLDGEIAVFDRQLLSRVEWLRAARPTRRPRRPR